MSIAERALMEAENADRLEGEFSFPVTLYGPDGLVYPDPSSGATLSATIYFNSRNETVSESGVVARETVVVFRTLSAPVRLGAGKVFGDKWIIWMPTTAQGDAYKYYTLDNSRANAYDDTIGQIRTYPKQLTQSPVSAF